MLGMFIVLYSLFLWGDKLWDLLASHLANVNPYSEIFVLFHLKFEKVEKNRQS